MALVPENPLVPDVPEVPEVPEVPAVPEVSGAASTIPSTAINTPFNSRIFKSPVIIDCIAILLY
jgi:hypothetical protein